MEFLVLIVIAVVVGGVLIPSIIRRSRTPSPEVTPREPPLPAPGEPAARREGRPLPGSGPDRRAKGDGLS